MGDTHDSHTSHTVAVIGATGYVGTRLVVTLLQQGYRVRAIGRSHDKLAQRQWSTHRHIELHAADVLDQSAVREALQDVHAAFYLVHSMGAGGSHFAELDRQAAENVGTVANKIHLERLVYLGGLGEDTGDLSTHLRSRLEVGRVLQQCHEPTTVLRAAMIIGSGSASFEIMRYLVERLPVMITPRWVRTENQPIAIDDVLGYLVGCLQEPRTVGQTLDIGGPDVLTYQQLMRIYAEHAQLPKRKIVGVPVLTPRLSSYWIDLVTPISSRLATPLVDGMRNRVVCNDDRITDLLPRQLVSCREAIGRALEERDEFLMGRMWSPLSLQSGRFMPIRVPNASAGKSVRKDAPVLMAPLRGFPSRLRSRLGPAQPEYVRGDRLTMAHMSSTAYTRSHAASRLGLQGHEATSDTDLQQSGSTARPVCWTWPGDADWAGGERFEQCHWAVIDADISRVWETLVHTAGRATGFLTRGLWELRGLADRAFGGIGMRYDRPTTGVLHPGDVVDMWRVGQVDAPRQLLLISDMKLPGKATLEYHLTPHRQRTRITQYARFVPRGLAGKAYWTSIIPLHEFVFSQTLREIATACRARLTEGPYCQAAGTMHKGGHTS